jgi:replicative DNA helicase
MSDLLKKQIQAEIEMQAKVEELNKKSKARQAYINDKRTTYELAQLTKNEKELVIARQTNFGMMTDEAIAQIQQSNMDYIEAAKEKLIFINEAFNGKVPFFRKNLILIGAKTGDGKSTTVANIVFSTLRQKNKVTGKKCRCLVITNEEAPSDVYNRITCHLKGWKYTGHDKFTKEMSDEFTRMIKVWADEGLSVIDNNYMGATGSTTSIEGIRQIFDNLIKTENFFDVVLIDYYQNVKYSKEQPKLNEYEVQSQLSAALDGYKNTYPAPIVLLAQVNPNKADEEVPFEYRIKGRKVITDPSTFIMEMVANRETLETNWTIHKSRFDDGPGTVITTGFDRGRYVEQTPEYKAARAEQQARRDAIELENAIDVSPKELEGKES